MRKEVKGMVFLLSLEMFLYYSSINYCHITIFD